VGWIFTNDYGLVIVAMCENALAPNGVCGEYPITIKITDAPTESDRSDYAMET
jgi:hypothetical protein